MKKIFSILVLCLFLCGCSTEEKDATHQLKTEGNDAPRISLMINSYEEFEQFLSFIDNDLISDGINKRDDYGDIYHKDICVPKLCAKEIKKAVDKCGYPSFDDVKEVEKYSVQIVYPGILINENDERFVLPIDIYSVDFAKNGLFFSINYYQKNFTNETVAFEDFKYADTAEVDGLKIDLFFSEKNHRLYSKLLSINDEYNMQIAVSMNNSNEKISADMLNFDGIHLFK